MKNQKGKQKIDSKKVLLLISILAVLRVLCGKYVSFHVPKGTKVTNPRMRKAMPTIQEIPYRDTRTQLVFT